MNAIFIDADNLSKPVWLQIGIQEFTHKNGHLSIRKAFGRPSAINGLKSVLGELKVQSHCCKVPNKNATDKMLIADVYKTIEQYPEISVVAIGSGDSDFLGLVKDLKSRGIKTVCISSNNIARKNHLVYDEVILAEATYEVIKMKAFNDAKNNSPNKFTTQYTTQLVVQGVLSKPPEPSLLLLTRKQRRIIEAEKNEKESEELRAKWIRKCEREKQAYQNKRRSEILLHVPLFKENPGLWIKKGIVTDKLLEFGIFGEWKTKATRVKKTVMLFTELENDFELNHSHVRWIGELPGDKIDTLASSDNDDASFCTVKIDSKICEKIQERFGLNKTLSEAIELALNSTF